MTDSSTPPSIYLDNNATTQADEEVVAVMAEVLREGWGNPSSLHAFGERASVWMESSRGEVMRLVGARSPEEIVFTSGGTESINAALFSALSRKTRGRVLTSAVEHAAVAQPLERYAAQGLAIEALPVDGQGRIDPDELVRRIDESCLLISLQLANNETGTRLPEADVHRIAESARAASVPFHLDAVQAPGKLALDLHALGVDLASISAHKFHGPQGVGALYVRRGCTLSALVSGGPQEAERRGGTQNVAGVAGMGRAAKLAREHVEGPEGPAAVRTLRNRLETGLLAAIPDAGVHGSEAERLDNTLSLHLPSVDGELLLASLAAEGLAVSSGAACSSRTKGPSPVLLAMGCGEEEASRTLRFSLSRRTTPEEIDQTLALVPRVLEELSLLQL